MRRGAAVAAAVVGLLAACGGCGGGGDHHESERRSAADDRSRLTSTHPCQKLTRFTCATLTVPLDHAGQATGTLRLNVGYATATAARRGVLLFLSGGPGQPGVPFLPRVSDRLKAALAGYRLVMLDQRGTGAGALQCPALQAAAGSSDLIPVPANDVLSCARLIGARRRYFTTAETLADIDELRRALGVPKLAVDGVSYGTFVAEHYALAYPTHVSRLVLDSVVPQRGVDVLSLASMNATARVLRDVCRQQRCGSDPARELAAFVRAHDDGARVLNALVADSIVNPSFTGVLAAIDQAAAGRPQALKRFLDAVDRGESAPARLLSQGLHEATLCLDLATPWNPRASSDQRAEIVARLAERLGGTALFPFDHATATANGIATGCSEWPATDRPAIAAGNPQRPLPKVPVLLFAGERDLSTPLTWAREEAAEAPAGRLIAVPRAGHSVQLRAADPAVRRILARFLAGAGGGAQTR